MHYITYMYFKSTRQKQDTRQRNEYQRSCTSRVQSCENWLKLVDLMSAATIKMRNKFTQRLEFIVDARDRIWLANGHYVST